MEEENSHYEYLKKVVFGMIIFLILAGVLYYFTLNRDSIQSGGGGGIEVSNKTILSSTLRSIDNMLLNL